MKSTARRSEIARMGGLASADSMTADERRKRAGKAARTLAKKRRAVTKVRDQRIILAFRYLNDESISTAEKIEAIRFLTECQQGVNLPRDSMGPYLFLARATGLTKQRVWAIVKKCRQK